jgi:hypothetical protein
MSYKASAECDAERRGRHSFAERGNEKNDKKLSFRLQDKS